MAITILWDTVDNAEVEKNLISGGRVVRTALVKGLTSAVTSSKLALLDAITAAAPEATLGNQFDPSYPYYCVAVIARGIASTGGTMARVWAHYETLGGGGTPLERFAAEDSGALVVEPLHKMPFTGEAFLCSIGSTDPNLVTSGRRADTTALTLPHPHVYRSLVLYGLFSDPPPVAVLDAGNTVNSATWQSRPRGYWRAEPARVKFSSRDGMFAVSVGFLCKGKRAHDGLDWSTYKLAPDPANPSQLWQPAKATMDTLLGQSYEFGKRWAHDGVYKAGLYELTDFSSVFGDTFPIGD